MKRNLSESHFWKMLTTVLLVLVPSIIMGQSVKLSTIVSHDKNTAALTTALRSGIDTLIIDAAKPVWFFEPIRLNGIRDKVIFLEDKVTIRARKGAFLKKNDALITLINSSNVSILGSGNRLVMNKTEYTEGEWRHGVSIRGSSEVVLKNIVIEDTGGDGIYIAGSNENVVSKRVLIENVVSRNNKRQGMSIISVDGLMIKGSSFLGTIGTLPGAGLDIEPNREQDVVKDVLVLNSVFMENYGPGIKIALHKMTGHSQDVSVHFKNCLIEGNHSVHNRKVPSEISFGANADDPVRGKVVFENSSVQNSNWGLFYSRKRANAYKVEFRNCSVSNMGNKERMPMIYLEVPNYYENKGPLGGFTFDNILFKNNPSVQMPFMLIRGSRLGTLDSVEDIHGKAYISGFKKPFVEYIRYNPQKNKNFTLRMLDGN